MSSVESPSPPVAVEITRERFPISWVLLVALICGGLTYLRSDPGGEPAHRLAIVIASAATPLLVSGMVFVFWRKRLPTIAVGIGVAVLAALGSNGGNTRLQLAQESYVEDLNVRLQALAAQLNDYGTDGGLAPELLTESSVLDDSAATSDRLRATCAELLAELRDGERFRQALEHDRIRDAVIRGAWARLVADAPMIHAGRMLRCANDLLAAGSRYLAVLRQHHGHWSVVDGAVVFDDSVTDSVIEQFRAEASEVQAAIDALAALAERAG